MITYFSSCYYKALRAGAFSFFIIFSLYSYSQNAPWEIKVDALYESGNYTPIIGICDSVIEIDSLSFIAYVHRGFTYYILGNYQSSINDFTKAMNLNEEKEDRAYYDLYRLRGNSYKELGEYKNALDDYNSYLKNDPYDEGTLFDRIEVSYMLDELEAVKNDMYYLYIMKYETETVLRYLGEYYYSVENYAKAVNYYEEVMNAYKYNSSFLHQLYNSYGGIGDTVKQAQLLPALAQAAKDSHDSLIYFQVLAIHKQWANDYSGAIENYLKVSEFKESKELFPTVYYDVSYCYYFIGDKQNALKYIDLLIESYPDKEQAIRSKAIIYTLFFDYKNALALYDEIKLDLEADISYLMVNYAMDNQFDKFLNLAKKAQKEGVISLSMALIYESIAYIELNNPKQWIDAKEKYYLLNKTVDTDLYLIGPDWESAIEDSKYDCKSNGNVLICQRFDNNDNHVSNYYHDNDIYKPFLRSVKELLLNGEEYKKLENKQKILDEIEVGLSE